jgi:predicted GNAT family acetyltransferase
VSRIIVARGEKPFLHSFSDNALTIALYHQTGQSARRRVYVTVLGNHS